MNKSSNTNSCTLPQSEVVLLRELVAEKFVNKVNTEILKCLASESRVKILVLIKHKPNISVCDIAEILEMSVSAISHQLRCLRDLELVATKRSGQNILYSLNQNTFLDTVLGAVVI